MRICIQCKNKKSDYYSKSIANHYLQLFSFMEHKASFSSVLNCSVHKFYMTVVLIQSLGGLHKRIRPTFTLLLVVFDLYHVFREASVHVSFEALFLSAKH